jgi:hypothetical protein
MPGVGGLAGHREDQFLPWVQTSVNTLRKGGSRFLVGLRRNRDSEYYRAGATKSAARRGGLLCPRRQMAPQSSPNANEMNAVP